MSEDRRPIMVTIWCTAYNHEPYIRQCLEGFVMQKTSFCFEALVHDDASTDGTAAIIREYAKRYPDIIKPIYETENQYSKHDGSLDRIMSEHTHGKYIATCEGDDYWTDPHKLQIQVEFLENNPEYSACFHSYNIIKLDKVTHCKNHVNRECDYNTYSFIHYGGLFCQLATLLYKKEYLHDMPLFRKMAIDGCKYGDWPLSILLSLRGKIHFFPEVMSCYRFLTENSWTYRTTRNKAALYIHWNNEIDWFKELNNYTDGNYKEAICYRIALAQYGLYRGGQISKCELARSINELSLKDKLSMIMPIFSYKCPSLYKSISNIKHKIWNK